MDTKAFKKLLKGIKFPGGKDSRVFGDRAQWFKRHGHAGAGVLARVMKAAREAGFVPVGDKMSSDATGDRVGRGTTMVSGNVTITFDSFYGQTAYENRFSICVWVKA
jgi:hypothetical protein